ncbi:MAG: ATP-dependent zinc metalloprotease FtsH [Thermodesulfobacteriota bacterium]|nr:ATP-dependent zinc metalloprotease FtsH [Thermodesulfobacteriota bacterium]
MNMEQHHKVSIWYFIIGVWIVLILQNYLASTYAIQTIPYSQFVQKLTQGDIVEVSITEKQIQGLMKSETAADQTSSFRTVRVDPDTSELLDKYQVKYSATIESTFFRDLLSWILPVLLFVGIWFFLMKRLSAQQPGFMSLGKNKAKVHKQEDIDVSFEDVAGVDEAVAELVEVIDFLKNPDKYIEFGASLPKGLLLVGPPGTGKTLLAQAVAGESHVPFYSISGSEFVELFVGMGAARVRDLFEQAKAHAPCIIFIDEMDALGKARGFGGVGGHDEREQTLNQLLVEMDGFDPNIGVVLMAATNRPEVLDPALLRPGRFDRQVLVDRPDKQGRIAILKVHLKKIQKLGDIDVEELANMTPGMVGADLASLVNEATLLAVRNRKKTVGKEHFEEAIERIIAGLEKKNRLINPRERKIVAYHELGHALVALSLPGTDPVKKITIVPRGIAALGYTMQVPIEDRFLMTKTELLGKIASLLGGRAAEEMVFKDISTGAHNDLAKATDIARSMVTEYGMSEKAGQVYYKSEPQAMFLQQGINRSAKGEYSDETARIIDQEVRTIIDDQYTIALKLLGEKREILEEAAVELLEKEKIDGSYLEKLIGREETEE